MSTPYPLEEREETDNLAPQWNPWTTPASPGFFAGMGFNDETADLGPIYRALEAAGSGAAKGEALLAGVWGSQFAAEAKYAERISPRLGSMFQGLESSADALREDAKARVDALTPDPATVGGAVNIIHGVGEAATLAATGGLAGGTAGAVGLLGGSEGLARYQELREHDVDPNTAAAAAAFTGVASGASLLIPASLGTGLFTRIATGAATQGGFGIAQRYADHKILELGGYPEMAAQQKVWDGAQIATDTILGGLLGGAHRPEGAAAGAKGAPGGTPGAGTPLRDQPGVEDAALTSSLAGADARAAPGVPVDPAAANAHQAALKEAMTDLVQGKPVDVSGTGVQNETFLKREAPDLTEAERIVVDSLRGAGLMDTEEATSQLERALGKRLGVTPEPLSQETGTAADLFPDTSLITRRHEVAPDALAGAAPGPDTNAPDLSGIVRSEREAAGALRVEDIPRAPEGTLTPKQRLIETRFAEAIAANPAAAEAAYAARPDAEGGRVINTDIAREVSPDYLADRTQSAAVHEPASLLTKRIYAQRLAESAGPGYEPVVMFTGGGTGAGKSTAIKRTLESGPGPRAQIVYDSNLDSAPKAIAKIDQALAAGKRARVVYVDRDPVEALVQGALKRAVRQEGEFGSGRTVPIETHIKTHVNANAAIREIAAHYAGNPNVDIRIINNRNGPGKATLSDLENLPKLPYNQVREKVLSALEAEREAGRISDAVYRGFAGAGGGPAAGSGGAAAPGLLQRAAALAGLGRAAGVEPQQQRAGGHAGLLTQRVATAAGRTIEVAPRIAELKDLVTSDQSAYPQELQPRARGARKALDAQVLDIAKNLAPERLGDSAEADRGAPIVSPAAEGNVVESGNGRVMALAKVYQDDDERAAAYRRFLENQGYDLNGFKQPVLVRERVTPMSLAERRAFALEANQAATAELSPVERAQADARMIDGSMMSHLAGADLTTAQNAPFVRDFIEALPQSEHSAMMNPDGTVSQAGVRRIQAAILARAYGGTRESDVTLGRILESTGQDLKSTLNALIDAAPAYARLRQMIDDGVIGKQYDVAPAIVQAVEDVAKLRASGTTLAEHLATGDMFSHKTLATRAFYDRSGTRLVGRDEAAAALTRYADQAMAQRLNQGSLFADTPASPATLLEAARAPPRSADMFGLRTPQGRSKSTAAAAGRRAVAEASAAERDAAREDRREEAVPAAMPERVLAQAIDARPNLEIVQDDGTTVRARTALDAANSEVESLQERAMPAVSSAIDCFSRVGT